MPPANNAPDKRKRVLSGMRPTGRLHIGHYFGALQNWIRLQDDPQYECFYFIADWHALTTDYADASASIEDNVLEICVDWLASGLDPNKCTMFVQSLVPEHAELHLLLSLITPLGALERIPTYKEALQNIVDKDLHTYGFLGYPVLQTADIVIYDADMVPVGEDQVPHIEFAREIVRKFNFHYGLHLRRKFFAQPYEKTKGFWNLIQRTWGVSLIDPQGPDPIRMQAVIKREAMRRMLAMGPQNFVQSLGIEKKFFEVRPVLREPYYQLTQTPRIPGLDGRKMSKSYGNAIMLSESDEDIRTKTKAMVTDPARKRRQDPGNPDVCPVFDWHKLFSPPETQAWSAHGCRTAGIGCIECKAAMADNLIKWIKPVREKRLYFEEHRSEVASVLEYSSARARSIARKTMLRVRDAVFGQERLKRKRLPAKKEQLARRTKEA